MEHAKTTGIVLKVTKCKNSSLALSVLSPDLGKINIWARGVQSGKNTQRSGCVLLTYSEFVLQKRGEMYTLCSACPIKTFYHLREDVVKLSYGVYFAELAGLLYGEGMEAKGAVRLLLNSLHYLENDLKDPLDLKVMYELRLMASAGFAPYVESCMECGNSEAYTFSPSHGGLLCRACSPLLPLPRNAVILLRGYVSCNLKACLNHSGKEAAKILEPSVEQFIRYHTDTSPKSLAYLHHIRNTVNL